MKSTYCILLMLCFFLASCREEERPSPTSLEGVYETTQEIQGRGSWYVDQFRFASDGTFEQISYWRESEAGERIGYTFYSKGTYTLDGIAFDLHQTQINEAGFDGPVIPVDRMEDLPKRELRPEGLSSGGILRVLDGGNSLSIRMGCNAKSGICLNLYTERIYKRID